MSSADTDPVPRFAHTHHWQGILDTLEQPGIWIDDLSPELPTQLAQAWHSLPAGGFIGGPAWGAGQLADRRVAVDTRTPIEAFFAMQADASALFIGSSTHHPPCWLRFKQPSLPRPERILILSGADERQYHLFGMLVEANHAFYAQHHGYQTRWVHVDRKSWDWNRGNLCWAKHEAVYQALEEGCWDQVWWIDADAVFVNTQIAIHTFLHPQWQAIHPEFHRHGGRQTLFSTGVFGCRPAAATLYRQLWEERGRHQVWCEEESLTNLVKASPERWKFVQLVEHSLFNGFYGWNFSLTDPTRNLTCHLVGRSNIERRRFFTAVNRHFGIS